MFSKTFLLWFVVVLTIADVILGQGQRPSMGSSDRGSLGSGTSGQPSRSGTGRSLRPDGGRPDRMPGQGRSPRPGMEGRHQPDQPNRDSRGSGLNRRPGMRGQPANDSCSTTKLTQYQGERVLSEDEIAIITQVLSNKEPFASLLNFICYIPPACIRQLNLTSPANASTLIADTTAVDAICECGDNKEVIQVVLNRVNQNTICTGVIEKLLAAESDTCDLGTQSIVVSKMAQLHGCDNVPIKEKLYWPTQDLQTTLDNLSADDLKTLLRDLASNTDEVLALPCENVRVLMDAADSKLFQSNIDLSDIWNLLPFLSASTCQRITPSTLSSSSVWKNIEWYCDASTYTNWQSSSAMRSSFSSSVASSSSMIPSKSQRFSDDAMMRMKSDTLRKCSFQCGEILANTMLSSGNIDPSQYDDVLGNLQTCLDEKTIIDSVQQGMCKNVPQPKNPRNRKLLASKCKPNKDITELTADDVKSMGCRIADVYGKQDLTKIPQSTLCNDDVMSDICKCSTSKDLTSVMANKCVSGSLNQTIATNLGPAVTQVKCDLLKSADSPTKQVIQQQIISGVSDDNPAKMTCMQDIINGMPITDKVKSKPVMETQTCTKAADESRPKKDAILSSDVDPAYTRAQKSTVLQEFLDGRQLSELTTDEMEEFRSIVEGAKVDSMARIPAGQKQSATMLLGKFDNWDGKQVDQLVKNCISSFQDLNPENPISELTPEQVAELGDSFLCGLSQYVRNMTTDTALAVCSRLGKAETLPRYLKQENRTRLAYSCWDAIGKTTLDENDIDNLGNLLPELGQEILSKIPADVLKNTGDQFSRIPCMRKNSTDYLQQRINSATSTSGDIPSGIWAAQCTSANKTKLLQNLDKIQQASRRTPSDTYCDKEPRTAEERAAMREAAQKMFDAIRQLANTPEGESNRRKRATATESCSVLDSEDYRDKLYLLSPDSIRDVSDFANCISAFGATEGWTGDQSDALWEKFLEAISGTDVCDLTSEQLVDMGTIGYSLTVDQIKCLKNLDTDALGALGSKQGWTTEQQTAMINTYMTLKNMNSPASLSAEELAAAGHFLCGLSADDINDINSDTYKGISTTLGNIIKTCESEALEALFQLATSAFGAVSSWDPPLYNDVCIVAAGMDPDDVRQLSSEDIRYLCNEAIQAMTKEHFQRWTADQLSALTVEQIFYLDPSDLSDDQRSVIETDSNTSDAGFVTFSFLTLLTALLAFMAY